MSQDVTVRFVGRNEVSPVAREVNNELRNLQGIARTLDMTGIFGSGMSNMLYQLRDGARSINNLLSNRQQVTPTVDPAVANWAKELGQFASDDFKALNPELFATGEAGAAGAAGLSAYTAAAVAAGIAAATLVVKGGQLVVQLSNEGQVTEQAQNKLSGFAGGALKAADAITAMNEATDYSLPMMAGMGSASRLMSMGLVDNAQQAAELTNAAMVLGPAIWSAEQRIQSMTMMLGNQSVRRMDEFGLSIDNVKAKQKELTDAGMGKQQAFTTAVLAEMQKNMVLVEASGVKAATSAERVQTAWGNLRTAIGSSLAPVMKGAEDWLANQLNTMTSGTQMGSSNQIDQLVGMEARVKQLTAAIAEMQAQGQDPNGLGLMAANAEIDTLITKILYLRTSMVEAGDVGTNAILKARGATQELSEWMDELHDKDVVARDLAAGQALYKAHTDNSTASTLALGSAIDRLNADAIAAAAYEMAKLQANMNINRAPAGPAYGTGTDFASQLLAAKDASDYVISLQAREVQSEYDARVAAGKKAADEYRRQMEAAGRAAAATVSGFLTKGMNFSVDLKDMIGGGGGKGVMAPGAGGPFEDIYRLQAWLNDGTWAEVGNKLAGGDKGKAKSIVEQFQRGIFSPEVIGAIDVNALAKEAALADYAAKTQEAFSIAIADKAKTSTGVVDYLMGMKADDKGVKPADTAAKNAMNSLATSIDVTVRDKKFADDMVDRGKVTWGYIESGFVDQAKKSGAFKSAIDAMVADAIAKALQ